MFISSWEQRWGSRRGWTASDLCAINWSYGVCLKKLQGPAGPKLHEGSFRGNENSGKGVFPVCSTGQFEIA